MPVRVVAEVIAEWPLGLLREGIDHALDAEVGVGVHYPPLHLFTLYRQLGFHAGQFPHAEDIGARTVTLPLFPAMSDADVDRVCSALAHTLRS